MTWQLQVGLETLQELKGANSNSLGDRKNVRITKSSNYRDSNYRGFCEEICKGSENFVRSRKGFDYTR